MTKTSWVELCVSDFEQSIIWFEQALGFRVVAREANEYAELSHGETSLQLAADDAPYWEPERPRLLPPGQRGSGVEIVLLVEDVDAVYRQAQHAQADIVRPLADYPWHMRQFWVRHPDGYLIRPAQRILSVNPTTYRRQVIDAFRHDRPSITQELLAVKQTADRLAQQGDVLGAATIYETLVMEIFEQSHLYFDATQYDDYYEENGYYPEEEGLKGLVEECIAALGNGLADKQADRVAREKSIAVLLAIYRRDLHADDSHGFAELAAHLLVRYTTPLERQTIAQWIHEALAEEEYEIFGSERQTYGKFWLDLEKEILDDEAYLRICRETDRTTDLVERFLVLGRIDEAVRETQGVDDLAFLKLADLFVQQGQDTVAERLLRARLTEKPALHLLERLQQYYRDRGNPAAELEIAEAAFRTQPSLRRYQELRDLAKHLDRWETLRPELLAFLQQAGNTRNTTLLTEIALDEGNPSAE